MFRKSLTVSPELSDITINIYLVCIGAKQVEIMVLQDVSTAPPNPTPAPTGDAEPVDLCTGTNMRESIS